MDTSFKNSKSSREQLKDKIVTNRKGYPFKENSIGSILTQVLLQEQHKRVNSSYPIKSFDDEQILQAGVHIKKKIYDDYSQTQFLLEDILEEMGLPSIISQSESPISPIDEFDNLKYLSQRPQSGLNLEDIAKKRIEQIKKANSQSEVNGGLSNLPIFLKIFDEDLLYQNLDKKGKKTAPIKLAVHGRKSIESIIFKFLKTSADLLEMSDSTYKKCINKGTKIPKNDVIDTILMYQTTIFNSGQNLYDFHYRQGKIGGELSGPSNNIVEKFFGVDYTRARIVTTDKNMNYLQSIVRNYLQQHPNFDILVSRDENFFAKREKDNSYVLGIEGPNPGVMSELRIQSLQDFINGEFGKNSHAFTYKPKFLREYKPVFKKSKQIQKIGEDLQIMFPEQKEFTKSLFK